MGIFSKTLVVAGSLLVLTGAAAGGTKGFADKPGGGKNDPIIKVSASIAPNNGALFSVTQDEVNALYQVNAAGVYQLNATPPVIPPDAAGANQFLHIKFPFKVSSKKVRKTLMKAKADFAGTSFLTPNINITDETGAHVPGIAVVNGKTVHGTKVKNDPNFPVWVGSGNKNKLLDKKAFVYVADDGDQDLSTISAFGPTPGTEEISNIKEVRVRVHETAGIIINGFWVLKIGDGMGAPATPQQALTLSAVTALSPVTPPKTNNGNVVVETFSKYVVEYSEPTVPWSVGFSASTVKNFNASNPAVSMIYNGNTGPVPNPVDLVNPFFPNFQVTVSPTPTSTFVVPYDVRPINPNNLSQYVINPILDVPGKVDVSVMSIPQQMVTTPTGGTLSTAVTSLYNLAYNEAGAGNTATFRTAKGRAFTNVPVSPSVVYFTALSGSGAGGINLDGLGFETNDPATDRVLLLSSNLVMCGCPVISGFAVVPQISTQIAMSQGTTPVGGLAGSHLLGCNGNTFGDATGGSPIGIGGNPDGSPFGPSTPIPGINEGSSGSTANLNSPLTLYPEGFETPLRNSDGDVRLAASPDVGALSDMEVGGFLDNLFFDSLNASVLNAFHVSFVAGAFVSSNTISDPPVPNPPPLRLPVGLPPVDIVFSQQKLLKPAFVIEGDEVWTGCFGCSCTGSERVLLRPNPVNPLLGDLPHPFPQSGPGWQTFGLFTIPFAARQQIGNFLYVADRDQGGVSVLNSNTFSVIDRITLPDPTGLGISPELRSLYVSNFNADSLSIIDTDPFSGGFHTEVARVNTGSGPRSVAVQPGNEDVLVANFLGDSMSILDVSSQTIRNTVSGPFSRPWEIIVAPRQTGSGWLNLIYMAYIGSQGTGDIVIYESGPTGATGFGADDIRWAVSNPSPFDDMAGMAYDGNTAAGASVNLPGGVFVAHRDSETGLAMLTRVSFVSQLPAAGSFPGVPLPGTILSSPGVIQRVFEPIAFWGGPMVPFSQHLNPGGQDQGPYDVASSDISAAKFHSPVAGSIVGPAGPQPYYKTNLGAQVPPVLGVPFANAKHPHRLDPAGNIVPTAVPDRMYISFPGDNRVSVIDPSVGGAIINSIEGLPSVGKLVQYFDQ